jgi:O-antigen ligase
LKSYGAALACAMPVALWAGCRLGRRWLVAAIVFQPLAIAAMFALLSRASVVAAALSAGVLAVWFVARHGRKWTAVLVAAFMIAAVVAVFLTNVRGNEIAPAMHVPVWLVDAHRQAIWTKGLELAADAPVFGWGFDTINQLPGADAIVPGSTQAYIPSHPHNWMIEVYVETGVIGFAAIVGTLVLLLWGAVRAARLDGAPGAAMLAVMAAFFFMASTSFSFWAFSWQATFILLAAIVAPAMTPGYLTAGLGRAEAKP